MAHGLGLIFSSSSSEYTTPASSREDIYTDSEFDIDLSKKPEAVAVLKTRDPSSSSCMKAVLKLEGKRGAEQWLAVFIEGSSNAIVIPPRKASNGNLSRFGLLPCLEWLESIGMSQAIMAVPTGDDGSNCRSLLFLGFSFLPEDVAVSQLPDWLEGYNLLVTDL